MKYKITNVMNSFQKKRFWKTNVKTPWMYLLLAKLIFHRSMCRNKISLIDQEGSS